MEVIFSPLTGSHIFFLKATGKTMVPCTIKISPCMLMNHVPLILGVKQFSEYPKTQGDIITHCSFC